MNAKHTPGPWHDSGLPDHYERCIGDQNGHAIAKVIYQRDTRTNALVPGAIYEGKANARLIAAAPEMLEVLKLTVANLSYEYVSIPLGNGPISQIVRAVQQVIDKATRSE